MDRIDRIFDRNTDIISALVSSAFDYDMPISSKVYPVYPVKFLFIQLPYKAAAVTSAAPPNCSINSTGNSRHRDKFEIVKNQSNAKKDEKTLLAVPL